LTDEDIDIAINIAKEFRGMIIEKHNIDLKLEDFGSSPSKPLVRINKLRRQ